LKTIASHVFLTLACSLWRSIRPASFDEQKLKENTRVNGEEKIPHGLSQDSDLIVSYF